MKITINKRSSYGKAMNMTRVTFYEDNVFFPKLKKYANPFGKITYICKYLDQSKQLVIDLNPGKNPRTAGLLLMNSGSMKKHYDFVISFSKKSKLNSLFSETNHIQDEDVSFENNKLIIKFPNDQNPKQQKLLVDKVKEQMTQYVADEYLKKIEKQINGITEQSSYISVAQNKRIDELQETFEQTTEQIKESYLNQILTAMKSQEKSLNKMSNQIVDLRNRINTLNGKVGELKQLWK